MPILDKVFRLYRDHGNGVIEIGPDRDDLGLIEVRDYEDHHKEPRTVVLLTGEEAEMVVRALTELRAALKEG